MVRSELLKMMSTTGARRLHKGDLIVLAGTQAQASLCYVLNGVVRIVHRMGDSALNINLLGPGYFFGQYSLVLDRPIDFDAIAAEPDTAIMYLNHDRFLKESRKNPLIMRELLTTAMGRLGQIMQCLVTLNTLFSIKVPDDLAQVITDNRERNLKILELVNNTRSAFVARERAIFRQGQPNSGNIYLVTEGHLDAQVEVAGEIRIAQRFEPGDILGFTRASAQPERAYSAIAAVDSRIMTFDLDYLMRLLQLNMECFWTVFRTAVTEIVLLENTLHETVDQVVLNGGAPPEVMAFIKTMLPSEG